MGRNKLIKDKWIDGQLFQPNYLPNDHEMDIVLSKLPSMSSNEGKKYHE